MFRVFFVCFLAITSDALKTQITGDENPTMPVVNIHVDEPALGPLEARSMGAQARTQRLQLAHLEEVASGQRQIFSAVLNAMQKQIAKLTDLAESSIALAKDIA